MTPLITNLPPDQPQPQPHPIFHVTPPNPEPSVHHYMNTVHPQLVRPSLNGRVAICPDCKIAHPECKVQ